MEKQPRPGNRSYLLTGLLTILPLFLTVYLIYLISTFLSRLSFPILEPIFRNYLDVQYSNVFIFITSILLTIIFIWIIGLIVTNFFGRKIFEFFDHLFARIPFFKNIYISIRRLIEHLTKTKMAFRKVVLVEYPRKGLYSIGFVTSETWDEIQNVTPEHLINVFVPTTPNPTSGVLIMVPQDELIYLSMSSEQAFFFIMSGGIVTPGDELEHKRV